MNRPAEPNRARLRAVAQHGMIERGITDASVRDLRTLERQVRKSAAALLLESRIGDRFDAIVTGAAGKGIWVRIKGAAAEGRLVHGFSELDVGDPLRAELVSTDVERGFVDFARIETR